MAKIGFSLRTLLHRFPSGTFSGTIAFALVFVNVFVQKGFKVVGHAKVLVPGDSGFEVQHGKLVEAIGTTFPILSVIEIAPKDFSEIVAPSYRLFPDSGPLDRIKESLQTYRVQEYQHLANKDDNDSPIHKET